MTRAPMMVARPTIRTRLASRMNSTARLAVGPGAVAGAGPGRHGDQPDGGAGDQEGDGIGGAEQRPAPDRPRRRPQRGGGSPSVSGSEAGVSVMPPQLRPPVAKLQQRSCRNTACMRQIPQLGRAPSVDRGGLVEPAQPALGGAALVADRRARAPVRRTSPGVCGTSSGPAARRRSRPRPAGARRRCRAAPRGPARPGPSPSRQRPVEMGRQPGPAIDAAPQHQGVGARLVQRLARLLGGDDVAVDDDGDARPPP